MLIGTASVQVRNSSHYDPTKADDLSKIKFDNYSYNFQDFNINKIRNWIIDNVQNYLIKYNYLNIALNVDYGISGDGIPEQDPITHHNTPGNLSDSLLQKFLDTTQGKTNLLITVYADDASDLAVGSKWKFIPSGTEVEEDNKEYIVIYGDQVQKWRIIKTNAKDINHRWMWSTHAKIYCWDGLNELEMPEINKNTGNVIFWTDNEYQNTRSFLLKYINAIV
ncbi:ICEF-II [Spiroplasma poulsonii]|uniref:Uncharacterized protein n=1 Tax=Spiroplasma poulsonii TaxID=2138 RepID=A0A2P6FC29_9MOLU|nr:ICEF-II [Spiroplasma poulsonii]PQM30992.1 hypothetical protein SMSRO_SF007880 [Spiroplasma poulsonii]PWF95988.1 hypothetical protein SMSE_14260 [Spiroplasma poulsonii]PWF98763.1 hypothetical protein SMH99_13260 [Spiroplasma poulsonii]